MAELLLDIESNLRLGFFLSILAVMMLWEMAAPARRAETPRLIRWSNNFALVVVDTLVLRLAFPILAVGAALWAEANGYGLLNLAGMSPALKVILALLALDLVIYGQHVAFHKVPVLWRLHRLHHADQDFDVTTGLRFHPFEIVLSMALKMAVVLVLGAPALAVLLFEIILNGTALFNHGNVRLGPRADRIIRWFVVTPDMHRVHHSIYPEETDSNYGFNFPWWDRLFGTYIAQPRDGHEKMRIGLFEFRTTRDQWLDAMLVQPFRRARKSTRKNDS